MTNLIRYSSLINQDENKIQMLVQGKNNNRNL